MGHLGESFAFFGLKVLAGEVAKLLDLFVLIGLFRVLIEEPMDAMMYVGYLCLGCNQISGHQTYHFGDHAFEECLNCNQMVLPESKAKQLLWIISPNMLSFFGHHQVDSRIEPYCQPFVDAKYDHYRKVKIRELRSAVESFA